MSSQPHKKIFINNEIESKNFTDSSNCFTDFDEKKTSCQKKRFFINKKITLKCEILIYQKIYRTSKWKNFINEISLHVLTKKLKKVNEM